MRPNSKSLALRDPALAALVGVIAGANFGSDFGVEVDDENYPGVYEDGPQFGVEFGNDYGVDFGYDFGADAAPGAIVAAPTPSSQQLLQMWQSNKAKAAHSSRRGMLLEPNKGSSVKVERYAFAINQTLTLGLAATLAMSGQPDTNIRPQRVTMNAPQPGFATINEIKVANVSVTVGGISDAFDYNALGVGQTLDMPTLSPANRASVLGSYTGFVPPGFIGGSAYLFAASFKGPASIVA